MRTTQTRTQNGKQTCCEIGAPLSFDKPLTPAQKSWYLSTNRCPACDSSDYRNNGFQHWYARIMYVFWRCNDCGSEWMDHARLFDVELLPEEDHFGPT